MEGTTDLAWRDIRATAASTARRILAAPFQARTWAELLWVVIGVPVAVVVLVPVLVGLLVGIGLSPVFVGLLLFAGVLLGARRLGGAQRGLARRLLGVQVATPAKPRLEPGLWNWIKARLRDAVAWRTVAYLLLRLPLSLLNLMVTTFLVLYGFGTVLYPALRPLLTNGEMPIFGIHTEVWFTSLPLGVAGLAVLLSVPWVLRGLLGVDRLLVRGLLGPATLSERVRDLERSRATAVEDATVKLRHIERDLHDGAQAHLVALAMKLGLVRDELDGEHLDLDQIRALVAAAHANAKEALTELRDLARGIHPPALDAGLDVALSTLAARAAGEVRVRVDLPGRPPAAIETIAYFTAAELLANAAKHAPGAEVSITVTATGDVLTLSVTDAGAGGARIVPGGGLAGLADRVRTVDGRLDITSPAGGPTVVTAVLPVSGYGGSCAS